MKHAGLASIPWWISPVRHYDDSDIPVNAHKFLDRLIAIIPSRLLSASYRLPMLTGFLRRILSPPPGQNPYRTVTLKGGPRSGTRLCLNMKNEKSFWIGTYEPGLQRILLHHLSPDQACYDVGAHIGYLSLIMSKCVGDRGKVYAFEPHPGSFERLAVHVRENNAVSVEPVRAAVSNRPGRRKIRMPEGLDPREFRLNRQGGGSAVGKTIPVRCVTLDGWFRSHPMHPPALIKIDVEGAEGAVLQGAKQLLQRVRPIILCEIHGHDCGREVWNRLTAQRYRITEVETGSPLNSPPAGGHLLALPR